MYSQTQMASKDFQFTFQICCYQVQQQKHFGKTFTILFLEKDIAKKKKMYFCLRGIKGVHVFMRDQNLNYPEKCTFFVGMYC